MRYTTCRVSCLAPGIDLERLRERPIRFVLTAENESLELRAGDRLDLEPGLEHSAFVGPEGVVCLEAQR